ncbi:MAG TPA: endonuclease III [Anaerovoracaceae bacterium]|nr:endonuclease III [Anaerovoracaceae bacterium]
MKDLNEIELILDLLKLEYPKAKCALDFNDKFQLLIAVALSAQTTDESVNKITPLLFEKYPDAKSLSEANQEDVEEIIRSIGLYKNKARNIIEIAKSIVNDYLGLVPRNYEELIKLKGVGRKTANVILSVGFGNQTIAVDTHVFRVSNRLGLANAKDPLTTEYDLMGKIPKERWTETHHSLIFHGRNCCFARNPNCEECIIKDFCNYYLREKGAD